MQHTNIYVLISVQRFCLERRTHAHILAFDARASPQLCCCKALFNHNHIMIACVLCCGGLLPHVGLCVKRHAITEHTRTPVIKRQLSAARAEKRSSVWHTQFGHPFADPAISIFWLITKHSSAARRTNKTKGFTINKINCPLYAMERRYIFITK